jgi:thiol-disulfide isomerase/thioredoxin
VWYYPADNSAQAGKSGPPAEGAAVRDKYAFILGVSIAALLSISFARAQDGKKAGDTAAISDLIAQGDSFAAKEDYAHALKAYANAAKLSHGTCASCLILEGGIERRVGDEDKALSDAEKAVKLAAGDIGLCAQAHLFCGILLTETASDSKDKRLNRAIAEIREALNLNPRVLSGHFDLGVALMKQGSDAEGTAELNTYLESNHVTPELVKKAREYLADPERTREPEVPDFDLHTSDGREITNDALRGKIVVIDFWATWCPPCRDAVSELADIRKKYADRPFELVSVSLDRDQSAWNKFIVKHHMDWDQIGDSSGDMGRLFKIRTLPTYFVLNADGFIRKRTDSVQDVRNEIDSILKGKDK